jgi:sulfide:quinone oxidoreductase
MPDFRRVTDDFFVAPQIEEADVPAAAAAGFRTIVNNRPDDEQPGQLKAAKARQAAETAGVGYAAVQFAGPPPPEAVAAMAAILADAPRPILAHCRSGTRSVTVWAMASVQSGALTPEAAIAAAAGAGYDLSGLAPALKALRR